MHNTTARHIKSDRYIACNTYNTEIQEKMLITYCDARRAAAAKYDEAFAQIDQITTPKRADNSTHVFHQYTLRISEGRDELKAYLDELGVPAMIYYPVPLHMQKAYQDPRYKEGDFPTTEQLSREVISLPMHTELDDEQIDFITAAVCNYFQKENQ